MGSRGSIPPTETRPVGLTSIEAKARLASDGPNELPRRNRRAAWRIALQVVREPMLAMLLAAGGIYLLIGDRSEAIILIVFAGFSVAVAIVQEARTEKALAALGELAAPRALVIRDGRPVRIPGREVVKGDLLVIEQGDRIAADARLIEADHLECDESLLTGESVPVHKHAGCGGSSDGEASGREVHAGSIATAGRGLACVTAIGAASQIGRIGALLATLESEAPRPQLETARIVRLCAIGGLGTAALVSLLYGFLRSGWTNALLAGIATAMSLLPEEFPVVLTVFLAMGAWRIARAGVLTRRTAAIDTLGAATVLCSDKTGTLTENRMTVAALWLPQGDVAMADGISGDAHAALLRAAALASAPLPVDPMEVAFHRAAGEAGQIVAPDWDLVHSNALRPDLLAMSNVWQPGRADEELVAAAKGAPEAIARLCRLDAAARRDLDAAATAMAARGMRVLGVASAAVAPDKATAEHLEHGFDLAGLIGLADPVRPGVAEAVAQCRAAGIRVVMITGDYAGTAQAIGAQIGLGDGETMTGEMVSALSDAQLAERVAAVSIFARTLPEQKLRIVTALKAAGEVVAMTGDGVNDAPALKAAHIGVAMGKRGTDVAREAAALVLVDDDFGSIVLAIRLGRRIYDNIRKAVGFIFAVHVPIAGLALLPPLSGLPILLGPIQIALLEMIIDPVCALVFEAERDESDIMQRPPRPRLGAVPVAHAIAGPRHVAGSGLIPAV